MKLRILKQDFLRTVGFFVLSHIVDLLCRSLKITNVNNDAVEELKKNKKNYVLAFWHGQMLLSWYSHRDKNLTALISKSKDGELLSKILKHWNYNVVRGSSHKGGDVALGVMVDYARNGASVAITPDGPTGPVYIMKAGAVVTAKKSNIPLVLIAVGYRKKRVLKSWDNFEIPKFFTEAKIVYSEPFYVKPDLSFEDTSALINKCEIALNQLSLEANNFGIGN